MTKKYLDEQTNRMIEPANEAIAVWHGKRRSTIAIRCHDCIFFTHPDQENYEKKACLRYPEPVEVKNIFHRCGEFVNMDTGETLQEIFKKGDDNEDLSTRTGTLQAIRREPAQDIQPTIWRSIYEAAYRLSHGAIRNGGSGKTANR